MLSNRHQKQSMSHDQIYLKLILDTVEGNFFEQATEVSRSAILDSLDVDPLDLRDWNRNARPETRQDDQPSPN